MALSRSLRLILDDLLVVDGAKILAVNVAGAGLAFVSHVLFARWLGVASYGTYVFALSWLNILFIAVQAGMNLSTVRLIAEYRARRNRAAMLALIGFSNRIVLALGAAVAAAGWMIAAAALPDTAVELRRTLYAAFALTIVLALFQQRAAVLQGMEKVFQATLAFEIVRPLLLLAGVMAATRMADLDAAVVMAVNLGVSAALLLVLMRYARSCVMAEPQGPDDAVPPWRRWLMASLPYVAVTGLTILLTQMDILMIGHFLGPEQAGLYAPAAKIALLVIFPAVAVRARFGPLAARLFAEGRTGDLQGRMNMATVVSVIACAGVVAAIIPGRMPLLGLFGDAYRGGAAVVLVLAIGYLVYSLMAAAEMFFLVGPFERANAVASALTLGMNLILNLVLIPRFGIEGAAVATGAAMVFRAALSATIVHRRTGVAPWARPAPSTGTAP